MALLFLDSFDHYAGDFTSGLQQKYTGASGSIHTHYGRHGSGMVGQAYCALAAASSKSIFGAAVRFFVGFGGDDIFGLGDIHGQYFAIDALMAGQIRTSIGNRMSPPDVLRSNVWHYVEMETVVSVVPSGEYTARSIDSCRVWVDGVLVLDETALGVSSPIVYGATLYGWNLAFIGGATNGVYFDDLYILDGSGAAPHNAPLGDIQIDVIRPNGVGATTQWELVGAPTNWDATNDLTPDDDTTRVRATTVGQSDLYQMEDINTNNGIIGAQLLISARRTEEGFAQMAPLLHHAGVTTALPARALSPTYFYRNRDCFVTMPNGDPLTDANVNALQAGVRRIL